METRFTVIYKDEWEMAGSAFASISTRSEQMDGEELHSRLKNSGAGTSIRHCLLSHSRLNLKTKKVELVKRSRKWI